MQIAGKEDITIFTERPPPQTLQAPTPARVEQCGVCLDPFEPNMPMLKVQEAEVRPAKRKTQIEEMADLRPKRLGLFQNL